MSTDYSIAQQLETLRLRLLDLSGRNRFLNFHFSERSRTQVRIVDELPDRIFETLKLESDKGLTIEPLPHPSEYLNGQTKDSPTCVDHAKHLGINPDYDLSTDTSSQSHRENKLQTLLYSDRLMSKLAGLREGSRKSEQEIGLNTLYLAFGMLEWYEADQSEKRLLAPLLLYPIALERELKNGQYYYTIKSRGEEPEENFSLRERLKRDFGIVLPEFQKSVDEEDESADTPESYFNKVAEVVSNCHRWRVRRFLTLSLFSFGNIALFQDLDPERWPNEASPLKHPLLNTILGGQENVSQEAIAPNYDVDQPSIAKKVPLIIADADASQFSALVDAMDGKNLVIEGPPGTGKSQTITNLIAVALAKGKKILFVAEKKAALEVVYNRLADAGLENYCLEVHSTATARRAFYERLKQRLEHEFPPDVSRILGEQIQECQQLKKQLTSYVNLLNQPFGRGGKTIQELLWAEKQASTVLNGISVLPGLQSIQDEQAISMTEADFKRKSHHLQELSQQRQSLFNEYSTQNHPWYGVTAHDLSPIAQGDLLSAAAQWSKVLKQIQTDAQNIESDLSIEIQPTLGSLAQIHLQLQSFPPLDALVEPALLPSLKSNAAQQAVASLIKDLRHYQQEKKALGNFFEDGLKASQLSLSPNLHGELQQIDDEIEAISTAIKSFQKEGELCASSSHASLIKAKESCTRLNQIEADLSQRLRLDVCPNSSDMYSYARVLQKSNLLTKLFSGKYCKLKKLWGKIYKKSKDLADSAIAQIFESIADFQDQRDAFSNDQRLQQLCGYHFQGLETDFNSLIKFNDFVNQLIKRHSEVKQIQQKISTSEASNLLGYFYQEEQTNIEQLEATNSFAQAVSQSLLPQSLQNQVLTTHATTVIETIQSTLTDLSSTLEQEKRNQKLFFEIGKIDSKEMFGNQDIKKVLLREIIDKLDNASTAHDSLSSWINYHKSYQQVVVDKLQDLIDFFEQEDLAFDHLNTVYPVVFYRSLLRRVYESHPELGQYSGLTQSQAREQFQQADVRLLQLYQQQLTFQLSEVDVEPGNNRGRVSEKTDLALIRYEINKQIRHIPQRKLFQRASVALQQLKPCWMMSPTSVAEYIPPGAITFDMVIIDEASQMRPEEAVGAIARSKQLVVVGDPKQLPPTDFFRTRVDPALDNDSDDEADAIDDESILDMALKVFYPARRLKWHYRSHHESLIAFSNQQFYDNSLTIFPSSKSQFAVDYHYVEDGAYHSSTNVPEMKTVAEATANFIRQHPDLSLGIVTLNQKQQQLLLDEMDRLFALHEDLEQYRMEREDTLEPFFVKNLENVQGDERDVIFISTVYGPEKPGMPVMQRFGPINSRSGHRRLNVLFTRAKERVVIFSSMQPGDIRPSPTSNRGVHVLKDYLNYAQTQRLQTATATGREPDSDFEIFVADRLRECGYKVVPQVGVSGYFIDLAVVDPQRSGTYLLGIECDGATYHSSKAARDRDRLRQQVLERLGWKIYRIWSTDWFTNSTKEIEKLKKYIADIT
ncbi:MAG: DUF4011 domain-containing protein [Cyanobacteria bacterium P01_F01_bin.150]